MFADPSPSPNPRWYDGTGSGRLAMVSGDAQPTKGTMAAWGSSQWAAIPPGSDGQCLQADSTQASGLKYAACGGAGSFSATYSSTPANNVVTTTTSGGALKILDAVTPLGTGPLLVQNNGGTKTYFETFDSTGSSGSAGFFSSGPFNVANNGPAVFYSQLANTTAATGGVPIQQTGDFESFGNIWDGAASRPIGFFLYGSGSSGGSYTSEFRLRLSRNNASSADALTIGYDGTNIFAKTPAPFTFTGSTQTVSTTWNACSFVNSWTNYGGFVDVCAYSKDAAGNVHLKGAISGGTCGSTAFTLPAGYRCHSGDTSVLSLGAVAATNGSVGITCNTGVVVPSCSSVTFIPLDNITFPAEQ